MKKTLLTFLILNLLFLCGCWDMREINELGLVTAVGIDKADYPNKYTVTVQVANPSTENAGDKSSTKQTVWVGTQDGESIFDAVRKLSEISSRRIMWAHNTVIILGESLAKEGIIPIIDFFTHNPELRMKTVVAVTNGDAKKIISSKAGMETPSGVSFILLESYRSLAAESIESHMLKLSAEIKNKYGNPLITAVTLKKAIIESEEGKQEYSETVELAGAAVFKKDKMLGWLSPKEARGVAWILNETKNTVVTVNDPEHENKGVSVETMHVKAKINSKVVDGRPELSINITGNGDIVEEDGSTTNSIGEVKRNVSTLVNKKIEDEIKGSLEIIQKKYKVDVLGFADIVHIKNDKEWESGLKNNWDELFPQIPVNVSVNIKIRTSTLKQEPININ